MDELIKTFHIDWKLLIAQIVNFAIVIGVLGFFLMKPLTKLMKDREESIDKGLKDAEQAEKTLLEAEELKGKEIKNGKKQAQEIVNSAEKDAEKVRQERLERAKKEVEDVVTKAKQKIEADKLEIMSEAKNEIGELILLALGKITKSGIDPKTHKVLIDQAIEDIKSAEIK